MYIYIFFFFLNISFKSSSCLHLLQQQRLRYLLYVAFTPSEMRSLLTFAQADRTERERDKKKKKMGPIRPLARMQSAYYFSLLHRLIDTCTGSSRANK